MSNKYSEIMNTSGLAKKLERLDPENVKKFYDLQCVVTEKIHGENFRVGIDFNADHDGRPFIGQKNNIFYNFEEHPNFSRFSPKLIIEIDVIIKYMQKAILFNGSSINPVSTIVFFGELYGKGMQKGFTFSFDDGLRVCWFDVKSNDQYFGYDEKTNLFRTFNLETPPLVGIMSMHEALGLDIENMKSQIAIEPYIEGIVITPNQMHEWWKFQNRLIVKYKTKRFAEEKQGKHKSEKPINNFVSKFVDFVTEARIEHSIQSLQESGVEIFYEMKDLQHIPKAVIADIEKEENDGNFLSKEDRKYLSSYIPKFYKQYLEKGLLK